MKRGLNNPWKSVFHPRLPVSDIFGFYYCIPKSEALNQSDNQPPALIRRNLGYAGAGFRFVSCRSLACVRPAVGRGNGYPGINPGTFTASLGQFRPSSDIVQF